MNNSVFISYRRSVSSYIARAVFQDLRTNGIDAFMDVESIDSGQFDTIILNQIAARPYFLLILTPGTLDRCNEPGDWLLREIAHAMSLKRIVIPLNTPNFNFDDAKKFLNDPLATELPRFNAVSVPHDYFEAAMDRLRTRFLKPIDLPVIATPKADEAAVQQKVAQVAAEPVVTEQQLSAQDYFERALQRLEHDRDGKIADYSEAIQRNPQFAEAYNNRGLVCANFGHTEGAITDYDEAIRLKPQYADAYYNRGIVRKAIGDKTGAIADYDRAIQLNPQFAEAYYNRGIARKAIGDINGAISDYSEAIRLNPQFITAYYNRGVARQAIGDLRGAIMDYGDVIHLSPNYVEAYNNRGAARDDTGDTDGAISDYSEVLRINPRHPYAYYNRALARAKGRDYSGSITDMQRFLELQPDDPDAPKARDKIARWRKLIG
jgi:tetratricopeptide (TPR) repeat protein